MFTTPHRRLTPLTRELAAAARLRSLPEVQHKKRSVV